ncbi:rhodanese-like domain-containing protein [Bacteroidota bacterium]
MKKLFIIFPLITGLLLFSVSCDNSMDKQYASVDDMVKEATANANVISVEKLKKVIDSKQVINLVDCRESELFVEGHIPGAINIPRGKIEFAANISNRRIPLYIYSQDVSVAALAYTSLNKMKYSKLYLVEGGWEKWSDMYPDDIEEGLGGGTEVTPAAVQESGGCGG